MPSSIPYDPSLALANVLRPDKLAMLEQISAAQEPIDAAQDELDSLLTSERSLSMTANELVNLNVDEKAMAELFTEINTLKTNIAKAAVALGKAKIAGEAQIVKIKDTVRKATKSQITESIESPVDYNRTQIKQMPLSADSLKLDAQYFSFDSNAQTSASHASTIAGYVSGQTKILGNSYSAQISGSVQEQANSQAENHDLQGTLVITAVCTHKNAVLLAPFYIDVDKGIRAWNYYYPDEMIKTDDPSNLAQIAAEDSTKGESSMNILSGATYGSSFVGMVHILNESTTRSNQEMYSTAESLASSMKVGNWFESYSGGFGVNSSFSNSAKNLLSTQDISSHITLVTMGLIPTIKANSVKIAVKEFADFSPDKMMGQLATLQNATSSENDESFAATANKALVGGQLQAIKGAQIKNVMSAVQEGDAQENKMLDINSLMTAFEDYVEKAVGGGIGVPITYYLKPLTRASLAQQWVQKYYPGEFDPASSADDSSSSSGDSGSK